MTNWPHITSALGRSTRIASRIARAAIVLATLASSATGALAAVDIQFKSFQDVPDPVPAGGTYTYAIEVENSNTDPAVNARMSLPLPAGVTFVSANTTIGSCSHAPATNTVSCNFGTMIGTLAGGSPATINIMVRPGATGVVSVTGIVATDSTEINSANNTQTANTTVVNGANLTFQTYAGAPSPVIAGANITYTSIIQNLGPSLAVDARISYNLAVGLQFLTGTTAGSNWSCNASGLPATGQTVTCDYTSSIANTANAATLTWQARVSGNQVGTLSTNASISSTTADGDLSNNSASADVTVVAGTDLQMVKTVSSDPVIGGQPVTFSLQVNNLGPHPASGITVNDTIPTGFTAITTTGTNAADWSCAITGQQVQCTRAALPVGSASPILINATAPDNASIATTGTPASNSANVTSTSQEANASNNASTVNFTLRRDGVDMRPINLTRSPNPVAQGSEVITTFNVRNDGPRVATGTIRATFQLAAGETFVPLGSGGSGWTCSHSSGLVTCERAGPVAVGTSTPRITIISVATATGLLDGTACVSQGAGLQPIEGEINPPNDCSNQGVTSTGASANLSLAKSVGPTTLTTAQDTLTYSLTVTNNGPSDAGNVQLTDPIPTYAAAYTFGSFTRDATLVTVTNPAGATCSVGATVTCDWTSFPNGAVRTVIITVRRPMLAGAFTNTANVFSSTVGDPDRSNNTAFANVTVDAVVDVALTQKTAVPNPVKAGVNLSYTIQARNLGPSPASNVSVTDTFTSIPGGITFVSATASNSGTCGALNTTTNAITCDFGTVESTGVRTMTVVVRPNYMAAPPSPRTFANTANVTTTSAETTSANNSQNYTVDILPAEIDLKIEETDLRDPVGFDPTAPATNLIVYRVDVTNNGPSFASNVQFTDRWSPPSVGKTLTFMCDLASATANSNCASPPVGSNICSNASPTVTCPVGVLAANATSTRYLVYRVDVSPASSGDTFRKDAAVTADEPETLAANNAVIELTTVRMLADMQAVSKTASSPAVNVNEGFNFVVLVRNNGPSLAVAARLTDTLPPGMVLTATPTSSVGSCTGVAGGNGVTCAFGDLGNGATASVTIPVRITTFPSGGTITNPVRVATDSIDTVPGNDTTTGPVNVNDASIAGSVYVDTNDNGIRDGGEAGIGSVQMRLTGTDIYSNAITRTTTTNGSGNYIFSGLPPSTSGYTVTEIAQPVPFFEGKDRVGSGGGQGPAGTIVPKGTDTLTAIPLASTQALTGYDFGELGSASIAGRVWHDRSNDGAINSGEATFLSGVSITLTGIDDLGNTVAPQNMSTNGSGAYLFTGLRPGTYTVTETQPGTYLPGRAAIGLGANGGATGTPDNTLASATFGNVIAGVQLRSGDAATEYNFGELLTASVAGKVYFDINNDNTQVASEPSLATVSIALTGRDYRGNTIAVPAVQTNAGGAYIFTNVPPSDATGYTITETQPAAYVEGRLAVGTLGGTPSANTVGVTTVTSTFTAVVVRSQDAGTGYDFAETGAGLSGYSYDDLNDNGIRDGGEAGIGGVTIALNGCAVSRTTNTDGLGFYQFIGIPACATYAITQTQPAGYSDGRDTAGSFGGTVTNDAISAVSLGATQFGINYNFGEHNTGLTNLACVAPSAVTRNIREPFNWTFTVRNTTSVGAPNSRLTSTLPAGLELTGAPTTPVPGGTCTGTAGGTAVSCNLGFINGLTNATVTAPVRLIAYPTGGTLNVTSSIATDGSDTTPGDNTCGAALTARQSTLAGTVFEDPNNDGTKQTTEVGINTVTLTLTGTDIYGNAVNVPTTTRPDGTYQFTALAPSNATGYTVTETQPALYADGRDTVGSVGGTASANDVVSAIRLLEGINATGYDFAEISQGLAGSVYVDSNNDGIRDAAERGIPNVSIRVTGVSSTGTPVDLVTTTDASGNYLFGGIPPANPAGYTLTETQPTAWADGRDTAGNVGGTATNDRITSVVLPGGRIGTGYNFGERGGQLCGYVYADLNNTGVKDRNEAGIPNVTMTLTGTDVNGAAITQTVTTQGLAAGATDLGRYCFVDLPIGTYTITETQPVDYNDGRVTPGTLGGTRGTNVITGIPLTIAGTTGDQNNFGELPTAAAALSGFVYLDSNHDRVRNEPTGRNSWTVELIRGDIGGAYTVIATTTTNPDGSYRFDGLPPGTGYSVLFRSPSGNYVYGYLQNLTLTANTELAEQNQPIDPSGVVYDVLTRNAVPGATVRIIGPAGFNPAAHLVGGVGNVAQVTGPTGEYRYLLLPGSPTGTYRLEVTVPTGYVQRVSTALPACTATLAVGAAATPSLVQRLDTAPPLTQRIHDPNTCPASTSALSAGADSTQYYLAFLIGGTSTHVINNHIPIEAIPTTNALIVTKTTPRIDVTRGELVPYTITIRNNLDVRQTDIALVDMIPPGFRYRAGSATVGGIPREPAINVRELRWPPVTIERGASLQIKLMLIVGTGVSEGEYVNQAWALNAFSNVVASNVATATVRIVPDPTFDCSDIIGKAFDDKNRNGYQDDGEPGLANVRLATVNGLLVTTDSNGRFHITCADVPNEQRGSNFVLKLDERTLPTGFRLTTPNPGSVVLTRGKMAKLNFGATVHRVVRIDLMDAAFEPGSLALRPAWATSLTQLFPALAQDKSVLRIGYGRTGAEDAKLASDRVRSLQKYISDQWRDSAGTYHLIIETEVYPAGSSK